MTPNGTNLSPHSDSGVMCHVDPFHVRDAIVPDAYYHELAFNKTKRTFEEATEYCESLGGTLPSTTQFDLWRRMYTTDEHAQYGFEHWNWTSTPLDNGRVPFRSLYDAYGGAAGVNENHGTICYIDNSY